MRFRVVAFLLSFALWVYSHVMQSEKPTQRESFSVLSFGRDAKINTPTVEIVSTSQNASSLQPNTEIQHEDPFKVRLPLSIPTIAIEPATTFNDSDVWKWEGLIGIRWLLYQV